MTKMPAVIQSSIRDFARNPAVRNKVLSSNALLMLTNKRDETGEEVFFVFPPQLYEKWYEWYEDMRDAELLRKAMKSSKKGKSWKDLKKELLA